MKIDSRALSLHLDSPAQQNRRSTCTMLRLSVTAHGGAGYYTTYTSLMIAISAASPRRGPIFTIWV